MQSKLFYNVVCMSNCFRAVVEIPCSEKASVFGLRFLRFSLKCHFKKRQKSRFFLFKNVKKRILELCTSYSSIFFVFAAARAPGRFPHPR